MASPLYSAAEAEPELQSPTLYAAEEGLSPEVKCPKCGAILAKSEIAAHDEAVHGEERPAEGDKGDLRDSGSEETKPWQWHDLNS
jgi:hypothetical protein